MPFNPSEPNILLFITPSVQTGGAENMLLSLVSRMDPQKFKPVVLCLGEEGNMGEQFRENGIPLTCLHMRPGRFPRFKKWIELIRFIRKLKPALIQGWMYHGNLAAQVASFFLRRKVPVIWSIHHSLGMLTEEKPGTRIVIRLGRWLSRFPAKIIYVSREGQARHIQLGYYRSSGVVLPNAVDTETFLPSVTSRREVRQELLIPEDSILIGFFGRYHPDKDPANFLQAVALVEQRMKEVHILMAGSSMDPTNTKLKEQIRSFAVRSVHLLGESKEVPRLMASLDILCISSRQEAAPLVLLEAMSCGIPCVSTQVGDIEQVLDGLGLLIPPGHPEALAGALEKIAQLTSMERIEMGMEARKKVVEKYSLKELIIAYEQLYHSLLN